MHIKQINNFKLQEPGFLGVHILLNWLFLWQNKNLLKRIFERVIIHC